MTFDNKEWQARIDQLADNPLFQLRVSLLNANISWQDSAAMTKREMLAIAQVWNRQQEDSQEGSAS